MTGWWSQRRASVLPAVLFASVPLAFLLAIVVFQLTQAVPQAHQARAETAASFQALRALGAVDGAAQDAERGQRGYLLTGRDVYLQPYTDAQARLPGLMDDLHLALRDSFEQQSRLLTLQADITTKMNELASTIAIFREKGLDAALAIVNNETGRKSMEAIHADLAGLTDAEQGRLNGRSANAAAAYQRVTETFVVGSIISGLALVAGAILLAYAHRRAAISERTLQATLDSVREGVAAFDSTGRLRAWNSPFAALLDLPPAALRRGSPLPDGQDRSARAEGIIERIGQLAATTRSTGRPALVTHEAPNGAVLEIFNNRLTDGLVTTVLDVSDQRQKEQALVQAQKLEAIGKMTGGVAHDFNNLLMVIMGSLAFMRRTAGRDPKVAERIDMMELAAERGARLTKQLLAFSRRQPLQPDVINLGHVMQETLPLMRRALGEGVVVESVVSGGLWNTVIDTAQFQSAVLNLAINSGHAMPEGGKLTVELSNAALDDTYAARHAEVEPGQYVVFAITDTGSGMDAATLSRAMEPFFTTKPPGEGSGLGLAQVYGFVRQSGGHIKIYSEVGQGTTVRLYLPRSLQDLVPAVARPASLAVTGTETVLLVDDDEVVRAVVGAMLQDLGYTVMAAASAGEALAMLEQGAVADLLFTDVVMPGMGGRQLADRALKILPSLRVLFTSGYTENAIIHNGSLDSGVELLSKPFDRERLAAKLRRLLDATPSSGTGRELPSRL
jgi:signal transduction histidine kinase/ActR/RegA family two-component response regulator